METFVANGGNEWHRTGSFQKVGNKFTHLFPGHMVPVNQLFGKMFVKTREKAPVYKPILGFLKPNQDDCTNVTFMLKTP